MSSDPRCSQPTPSPDQPRVAIVGAGIAGLAAAIRLQDLGCAVTVVEAAQRPGGKLVSSRFAGIENVDEGADAYLTRVPAAARLASTVGVDRLKHPTNARAAVWRNGLHRLPEGLLLGVPASLRPMVTTPLLSWRGKLRAAADVVMPASRADHDCIGALTRKRIGDEAHELLVDTLVGSIYATDTDNSSLAAVPQLAALNTGRSLVLGARAAAAQRATAPTPSTIFAAPSDGMQSFAQRCSDEIQRRGGGIIYGHPVEAVEPSGKGWQLSGPGPTTASDHTPFDGVVLDGVTFDGVVIATPSGIAASIAAASAWSQTTPLLADIEAADVIMIRLRVPASQWPRRLAGLSGYLVPKPLQRWVTAASFGSQKWGAWTTDNGDQVVRISLGRDKMPTADLDDNDALEHAVAELSEHIGADVSPTETSLTRWIDGFPQYRPHHSTRVDRIETTLPTGIALAGASYRGIGIPACIASGQRAAETVYHASKYTGN